MSVITGNPDFDNFFDKNYELRFIEEFADLIEAEGIERAGKILWAIWLIEDPDSKLYDLNRDVKEKAAREYLKLPTFNFNLYVDVTKSFRRNTMGRKKRMYADYVMMMEERHEYMKQLSYDTNFKDKDGLLLNTKKIWDELAKVEAEYIKDQGGDNRVFGGEEESAAEKGLI